jgi:hypothetical protein
MAGIAAKRQWKLAGDNVPGMHKKNITSRSDDGTTRYFRRPFRTDFAMEHQPGTLCRANFPCPCRDNVRSIENEIDPVMG